MKNRQVFLIRDLYYFSNISALLFSDSNFWGYLLWSNFSEHRVINFHKFNHFFISNMFIRKILRIDTIWETSKKHGRAEICSIDNKILIFKNSYSPSQSKTETLRDVFKTLFELLTISAKRFISDVWQDSEYSSATNYFCYSSLGKKLIQL